MQPSSSEPRRTPAPTKGILRLSIPLVISFGLRSLYSIVDTLFAANLPGAEPGVGDASVAAIGLTVPLEFLIGACWIGVSNGLTAKLAEAMGADDGCRVEQLKRATARIVWVLIVVFLGVAAGAWVYAPAMGLGDDVTRQFQIYAAVLLGGSAITAFWSILPDSLVKAHQDTEGTMWAGLLSGGTNVAFNALFVFVFGWGIFGIALSTIVGRTFALAYALWRAGRHERARREELPEDQLVPSERPGAIRDILFIAVPSGITFVLMSFETGLINWIVARSGDPTPALAAWSIFDRSARFLAMPMIAIGVAMLPLVARLWGARDVVSIRRQLRVAALASLGYLLVIVVPGVLIFGDLIADVFTQTDDVRERVLAGMSWLSFATLASAPFFPLRSAFEGMGKPRPGVVVSVVRVVVLVLPFTWGGMWLAERAGLLPVVGVYAGSTLAALVGSVWMALWMRSVLVSEQAPRAEAAT